MELRRSLDVDIQHWNLMIRNRIDYLFDVRPVKVTVHLSML